MATFILNQEFTQLASEEQLTKTVQALETNGIRAVVVETGEEARTLVLDLIPSGAEVYNSPSRTLELIGLAEDIEHATRFQSVRARLHSLVRVKLGIFFTQSLSRKNWRLYPMKILESPKPRVAMAISRAALSSLRVGTRIFNPLTLSLAGSRRLPLLAVIHHQGRRSGRSYATPLGARLTADGFVIPLTFGERADWFRNVRATGECVIRWKGADYPVIEPEVVDWATAWPAFYPAERVLMPLIGIEQFVRLRHAPDSKKT